MEYLESTLNLSNNKVQTVCHQHIGGEGEATEELKRRSRKGLFMALLCAARGPGPPPPTRDDAAPCRVCIINTCDPSATGAAAALGTSLTTTTSDGGGEVGHDHESKQSFLSLSEYELCHHLCHVNAKGAEAMEGLLNIIYDGVEIGV